LLLLVVGAVRTIDGDDGEEDDDEMEDEEGRRG